MDEIPTDEPVEIYLAGHVDNVDDATSWRDEVIDKYGVDGLNFVNPVEEFSEYGDNPGAVVSWCLERAKECDGILVGGWKNDVPTFGTTRELHVANFNGRPVVMCYDGDPEDISYFIHDCITGVVKNMDRAITVLLFQIKDARSRDAA